MTQSNKVIVVLSPNLKAELVAKDLLSVTMYADSLGHGVFPLSADRTPSDGCIWVSVAPNHAELNAILGIENTEIIIQTHTIGEISRVSGDMFQQDLSESVIGGFTREQHQYKRIITPALKETNVTVLETAIGSIPAINEIWELAKTKLVLPEPTTATEQEPVQATEEPVLDFDNPEPEQVEPEVEQPSVVDEQEEPTPPINEPEPQETKPMHDPDEFDPLAPLAKQPLPIPATEAVVEDVTQTKEHEPEPVVEDFEKALFDSLAHAESVINPETETKAPAKRVAAVAYGIPEVYPSVDQTVTFDATKLFKDSKGGPTDQALHDFGGNIRTFQVVHNKLADKLERAISNNREDEITDFEASIYNYGNDQVSTSDAHNVQYVEGARWANMIKAGPTAVPIIMPIRDPEYGDAKYVGPECVSLVQNRMKTGCKLGVWLPHSGIYFIIVSPGDSQFLDTLAIINNQRIEVLRTSSGILLGNSNYYINRQVIKLFIDSIVHCSLKAWNRELLMKLINERDINILACALGASIYPDGYEYVQTCGLIKTDKTVCQHQTKKLIDLRRLVFVDNSRLTENQRTFAAGALTERSVSEVENYQAANYIGYKKPYEITTGIQFVYRSQSSISSIEAGEQWIKEIEQVVDNIITFKEDEDTRNLMIQERINLTRIREYSQWVEEILIDDQPLTDRTKINALLNTLSRNKEVVEKVGSTLTEFQRLASVAIVAVPRCACVECQKTDQKDLDISTHLIPQDAVSRLFTLVRQR